MHTYSRRTELHTYIQVDRQTDRVAYIQACRQAVAFIYTGRKTVTYRHRQRYIHTDTDREGGTGRQLLTVVHIDRERDRT